MLKNKEDLKRPKQMDFFGYDNRSNSLLDKDGYITALEKYCNQLEKALDNACEYTHDCGSNGCPFNYDISTITNEKINECNICDYQCMSLDEELNSNKQQRYEHLKKSMKCWKEYFLRGDTENGKN
nr:MAG TPA: Kruppel-like factor 3 finger, kruppel-like, DNA BINDING [Caudoviricetes sp.]